MATSEGTKLREMKWWQLYQSAVPHLAGRGLLHEDEAHDVSILDHCTSSKVLAKFVPTEAYERL